jgi:hypothetical protein
VVRFALCAIVLALAALGRTAAAAPCPPRPLPPALESLPPLPEPGSSISFAATPWEYPGRAWVVRASRRGRGCGTLAILRLLRQRDCNRYEVEARWQAPLPAAEYLALADAVAPLGTPPADTFSNDGSERSGDEVVLDGTGVVLRLRTFGWEVNRELNHYGRAGGAVSTVFRALVARHVPRAELPEQDWRTRRSQRDGSR